HCSSHPSFCFPTTRPPQTCPLFPYTTLFRSNEAPEAVAGESDGSTIFRHGWRARSGGRASDDRELRPAARQRCRARARARGRERSEEHTSELQSLAYLVCRLLLEKKKCLMSD